MKRSKKVCLWAGKIILATLMMSAGFFMLVISLHLLSPGVIPYITGSSDNTLVALFAFLLGGAGVGVMIGSIAFVGRDE